VTAAGDVLNVMRSLLGTRERPGGSNLAAPVTSWYPMVGPWCAMTVSYALAHAGHDRRVKFAWCPSGVANFKNGTWGSWHSTPQPGDLIFFSLKGVRPDHVGLVESVQGNRITTLEGNVGDACKRLTRDLRSRSVLGFGRPRYSGASAPTQGQPTSLGGLRTLALGASGPDVKVLQQILIGAGMLAAGQDDGKFGPITRRAVIELQEVLRVRADGIVGPRTREAIDALLRFVTAR
jgi:hypothetical protein